MVVDHRTCASWCQALPVEASDAFDTVMEFALEANAGRTFDHDSTDDAHTLVETRVHEATTPSDYSKVGVVVHAAYHHMCIGGGGQPYVEPSAMIDRTVQDAKDIPELIIGFHVRHGHDEIVHSIPTQSDASDASCSR